MKRNSLSAMRIVGTLSCVLMLLPVLVSCRGGRTGYRQGPDEPGSGRTPGGNTVKMVENKNWTLSYKGRIPVYENVSSGNETYTLTFVSDVIGMTSNDSENYYISIVSKSDFEKKCNSNYLTFASGDLDNVKKLEKENGVSYLRSGSFEEPFDPVDEGGGQFYAIAYGVAADGDLSGSYASLLFTTNALSATKSRDWDVSYGGRGSYTGEDTYVYYEDIIGVKAFTDESYVVDIASNQYINSNFDGNLMDYFWSVSDYLWGWVSEDGYFSDLAFGGNPLLLTGNWNISFNRLYPGNWTAYAIGMDANGVPTGNYSAFDFSIEEETPKEEFKRWLGKWTIGSSTTIKDDENGWDLQDRGTHYQIEVLNLDSNYEYEIRGWEQGEDADQFANDNLDYKNHSIVATWDESTGKMVIQTQYMTTMTYYGDDDSESYYDDILLGKFFHRQGRDTYLYNLLDEGVTIASASMDPNGGAVVQGEKVRANVEGTDVVVDISGMQIYEFPYEEGDDNIYYFNETVPCFPLEMRRQSKSQVSASSLPSANLSLRSEKATRRIDENTTFSRSSYVPRRSVSASSASTKSSQKAAVRTRQSRTGNSSGSHRATSKTAPLSSRR